MKKQLDKISLAMTILIISMFISSAIAADSMTGMNHDMPGMTHDQGKMMDKSDSKTITVTGEVVDISCFIQHDGKGEEHASCAQMCIAGGQPAGIVDAKGNLYIILGEKHQSPAEIVKGLEAKQVKATGTLIEKSGGSYLVVSKIEEVNKKQSTSSTVKKVYTCTMHPEVISDKPGDCPKCGMKLVLKKN